MGFKLSNYRRLIQAFFFIVFFVLLGLASKQIDLPFPAQIFLAADPLVALVTILAGLPLISALLYSLITVIVTLLFGRVFCGYACPMGTFFDLFAPLAKVLKIDQKIFRKLKSAPLAILAVVLTVSLFTVNILMIFDPIVLITRTFAVTIFPAINYAVMKMATGLQSSESLSIFLDKAILKLSGILVFPSEREFNSVQWITLLFIFLVSLNALGKRFWCRYLCPLGGLLGLIGRIPLYRRKVDEAKCKNCLKCVKVCEMDAVTTKGSSTDAASCLLCLRCREKCPRNAISWGLKPELTSEIPSRRVAVTAIGGSIAAAYLVPFKIQSSPEQSSLIRPPGVSDEDEFLNKCIRCGECLKVCPTNVLQPALLQYGIGAFWTPHMDFVRKACDWSCNACGRVCPTGAVQHLTLKAKQKFVIGKAVLDRHRCYPWIAGHGCRVCADMCPIPDKAVKLDDTGKFDPYGVRIELPYVIEKNCTGCGICQANCPTKGKKAITVIASKPITVNAKILEVKSTSQSQSGKALPSEETSTPRKQ